MTSAIMTEEFLFCNSLKILPEEFSYIGSSGLKISIELCACSSAAVSGVCLHAERAVTEVVS
mgnify:CR=1 FL=1